MLSTDRLIMRGTQSAARKKRTPTGTCERAAVASLEARRRTARCRAASTPQSRARQNEQSPRLWLWSIAGTELTRREFLCKAARPEKPALQPVTVCNLGANFVILKQTRIVVQRPDTLVEAIILAVRRTGRIEGGQVTHEAGPHQAASREARTA